MLGDVGDIDRAWKMFTYMEATQWQHLPEAGGLLDQDDLLMDNIMRIKSVVRKMVK
jgi:hypothetical protein